VYDPRAPSSLLALAEYGKPEVARKLIRYANWRTRDVDEAKDLVADALMRVCDPDDKPWDPQARSFFRHFRRVMDDDAIEAARTGPGRFEVSRLQGKDDENDDDVFDRVVHRVPGPDAQLNAGRRLAWLREMMDILVARIGRKDPLSMRIWRLVCDKKLHDEPEEYAEALGVHVTEIYEALRRLRYHGAKVRAGWEAKEKQRMDQLREPFERARNKEEP
jgi:DNA-directed RNA polymerase specialized sigma24 family protein